MEVKSILNAPKIDKSNKFVDKIFKRKQINHANLH